MSGGFLMALGGAMKGYGDASLEQMKADALAKREEALSQAKFERDRLLAADTRQFQSAEDQKQRDFTASENEKTRAADADYRTKSLAIQQQNADTSRSSAIEVEQTPDGSYARFGSKMEPLTDKDGKRIDVVSASKEKPAIIAEAEWLMKNGQAATAAEAYEKAKSGVTKPPSEVEIEKMAVNAAKLELGGDISTVSPEDAKAAIERNRAYYHEKFGLDKKQGKAKVPAVGEERKGFRFKGGDPSDKNNWEQVK